MIKKIGKLTVEQAKGAGGPQNLPVQKNARSIDGLPAGLFEDKDGGPWSPVTVTLGNGAPVALARGRHAASAPALRRVVGKVAREDVDLLGARHPAGQFVELQLQQAARLVREPEAQPPVVGAYLDGLTGLGQHEAVVPGVFQPCLDDVSLSELLLDGVCRGRLGRPARTSRTAREAGHERGQQGTQGEE